MQDTIKCPHCGVKIEVSEALTHQIHEQVLESTQEDYAKKLQEAIKTTEEATLKKINEDSLRELASAKKEAAEEKERSNKLVSQLENLSDEIRKLRRKDEERDLEMKRKLASEEEKIREDAARVERERSSLDIAEMKKKLEDTQKALADAQSKAKQGSQQLQGEVLELDLEDKLRSNFIFDDISPIGKGVQGADVLQTVRNQSGKVAGIILWETKRAKWTPSWIPKLKEDGRKNDATMTVLVCENIPAEIDNFKIIDGVVVTSRPYFLAIAGLLRRNLMLIAQAKSASVNKDEKLEMLYDYIQSDAFRHRFEAFTDGIKAMEEDLLTEQRSFERIWKKRETQIKRLQTNSSRMFGELQGIIPTLPETKTLSLLDRVSADKDNDD